MAENKRLTNKVTLSSYIKQSSTFALTTRKPTPTPSSFDTLLCSCRKTKSRSTDPQGSIESPSEIHTPACGPPSEVPLAADFRVQPDPSSGSNFQPQIQPASLPPRPFLSQIFRVQPDPFPGSIPAADPTAGPPSNVSLAINPWCSAGSLSKIQPPVAGSSSEIIDYP